MLLVAETLIDIGNVDSLFWRSLENFIEKQLPYYPVDIQTLQNSLSMTELFLSQMGHLDQSYC